MNSTYTLSPRIVCTGLVATCLLLAFHCAATTDRDPKPFRGKGLMPARLRCESLVDPLGIQETVPRLDWIVESGERGQRQTAYRILVASSAKRLERDEGDLWDSTVVKSDETLAIEYGGKPVQSHQLCFWKVKVWDKSGKESHWSQAASWSVGLLKPEDWKGDWIGFDKPRRQLLAEAPFDGAKWIWHAADEPGAAPAGKRLLLATFEVPAGARVKRAVLYASADDGMTFAVNNGRVLTTEPKNESWRKVAVTDITARIKPGTNHLRALVQNATPGPAGLLAKVVITTDDDRTITRVTDNTWKSAETPDDNWLKTTEEGLPAARVIADYGAKPWGKLTFAEKVLPPAVFLRGEFHVEKPVARAVLYASALGLIEPQLNGRKVTDDYFTPGWTDYSKRVYYRAYDVTRLVRNSANVLGAVLADGWFSGYVGYRGNRDLYGKFPRARLQLHLEFADGSTTEVATGPDWKASTGPIREADFLNGETYDASLEMAGWSAPGFAAREWGAVDVGSNEVHPLLQAHPGPPVRIVREFRARSVTETSPGVYVLDLGQNFAGIPRLELRGEPGQKITLRFAERLNPDGTIYTTNLRAARATDTYICRDGGTEIWQPQFTFHGFQYIEVSGLRQKPRPDTVVGLALSSDTPNAGSFSCSDPMLNQLHNNIYWTQRANFIDIPTDCPQRDERLGWTGDAQVYVRTATLNADVQAFFTKWLVDLDEDGQREDGQFPCVAPVKVAENDGGPAWADAGVVCPWTMYAIYGDRRALERYYPAMTRFIEFCRARSTPELLPPTQYHCYGDWLSIKADTPKDVIYTAYFAYSTRLVAQAAEVLRKTDDAAKYNDLFQKIKAAFNRAYVSADGRIKGNTQCCYVLALAFDLVDGETAKLAAQHLVDDIAGRDWHLSTGFIGTKDLMLVLSRIGRADVAYRLLHNDTFPSWGFSIKHGATSIWERWDGWTPEKGFQDPGMNSFAHYSFGAVYGWMVDNIGGIFRAAPAYKEILVAPQLDDKLTSASVAYESVRGRIATEWKRVGGKLELRVAIPANTTATVAIPAKSADVITANGRPLTRSADVRIVGQDNTRTLLSIGSGDYTFVSRGW